MSIQISVMIWTVICFLLLMFILHNLLFKPVLEVMEKRRSRIEKAKEKQAEILRLSAEIQQQQSNAKVLFEKEQKEKATAEVERIYADSKHQVEQAHVERMNTVEKYREDCFKEYSKIASYGKEATKPIAVTFADRIINESRIR